MRFGSEVLFRGLSIQKNCHSPACRLGGLLSFQHGIPSELLKPQRTYLGSLFRDRKSRISISKGPLLISLQVCRPNFQDWIELEEAGESDTGGYVALILNSDIHNGYKLGFRCPHPEHFEKLFLLVETSLRCHLSV